MMGDEVRLQGEKLNLVITDLQTAQENAKAAESQIVEAEEQSRGSNKKLIFLSITLIIVVVLIIVLIVLLLLR